jgi:hypothetical protein
MRKFMTLKIFPALALTVLAQITINLYDTKSRNKGYVKVSPRTGAVDVYDEKSNRVGYGKIQGNQLQLFKPNGERQLTGQPAVRGDKR